MAVIFDPLRGRVRPEASHSDAEIIDVLTRQHANADWAVLTGAGMSTDSGVPDYRGPDSPPRKPMTIQTFLSHPDQRARYWARSWMGWPRMRGTRPNRAHLALAELPVAGIITQNVDGLHQSAAEAVAAERPRWSAEVSWVREGRRTLMEGFVRQAVLIVGERAAVPAVVCVAGYTRVAVALILRVRYPELSSVKAESFRIHWSVSVNCAPYWL
ncbi:Sir2 family NAD-dependent protein deacetylase [Brevibacterium linens]|uniref:Sir2 family NAD-dependent protein deacetylase n=1 Tax=Brevibacterium linens TaxID=1703 RepID=UPI0026C8DEEC